MAFALFLGCGCSDNNSAVFQRTDLVTDGSEPLLLDVSCIYYSDGDEIGFRTDQSATPELLVKALLKKSGLDVTATSKGKTIHKEFIGEDVLGSGERKKLLLETVDERRYEVSYWGHHTCDLSALFAERK